MARDPRGLKKDATGVAGHHGWVQDASDPKRHALLDSPKGQHKPRVVVSATFSRCTRNHGNACTRTC
jgi:hypothetical protein